MMNSTFRSTALILIFGSFLFQGCLSKEEETDFQKQRRIDTELITKYIAENNITATQAGDGYYFYPVVENADGETTEKNNILGVYYTMSLLNGIVIGSHSPANGAPIKFEHLNGTIVPVGLDLGASQMKEGEKYNFIIPSTLAFASFSAANMPANAVLLLSLELAEVLTPAEQRAFESDTIDAYIEAFELNDIAPIEKTASGLYFQSKEEGTGANPSTGERVTVNYVGTFLDGTEFDKSPVGSPFEFALGQGQVIKGWDEGIKLMKKGGKARLIIPSHLAYGASYRVFPQSFVDPLVEQGFPSLAKAIPPFSILIFDVELL